MKITPDTNILVRAAVKDDPTQTEAALKSLSDAETIAIPLTTLCEFVWVLRRTYKRPPGEIASSIMSLIAASNVQTDRPAAMAGLDVLRQNGDFADGVIAFQGAQMGAETFLTFDKKAGRLIEATGQHVTLLPS